MAVGAGDDSDESLPAHPTEADPAEADPADPGPTGAIPAEPGPTAEGPAEPGSTAEGRAELGLTSAEPGAVDPAEPGLVGRELSGVDELELPAEAGEVLGGEVSPSPEVADVDRQPKLVRPYIARHYEQQDEVAPAPAPRQRRSLIVDAETVETVVIWPDRSAGGADLDGSERATSPRRGRTTMIASSAVAAVFVAIAAVWAGGWLSGAPVAAPSTAGLISGDGPTYITTTTDVTASATVPGTPTPTSTRTRTPPTRTNPAGPAAPTSSLPAAPTTPAVPAPPATTSVGAFVSTLESNPKRCVDVRARLSSPGTIVQSYECNNTPAQIFTVGTDGRLRVDLPDVRCAQASGTGVVIDFCADPADADRFANQQWRVLGTSIRHLGTGKCLTIPGANLANSVPLQLETCTDAPGQRWNLS